MNKKLLFGYIAIMFALSSCTKEPIVPKLTSSKEILEDKKLELISITVGGEETKDVFFREIPNGTLTCVHCYQETQVFQPSFEFQPYAVSSLDIDAITANVAMTSIVKSLDSETGVFATFEAVSYRDSVRITFDNKLINMSSRVHIPSTVSSMGSVAASGLEPAVWQVNLNQLNGAFKVSDLGELVTMKGSGKYQQIEMVFRK